MRIPVKFLIDESTKSIIRNQGCSPDDLGLSQIIQGSFKRMIQLYEAGLVQIEVATTDNRMLFILPLPEAPAFCDRVLNVSPLADITALDQLIGNGRQLETTIAGFKQAIIDYYAKALWERIQGFSSPGNAIG